LVENIGRSLDNSTYGIATVQPNKAIRRCRIRKLRIEYIISENAIILTLPKSCEKCRCMDDCTDDFILQIIEKIANKGQSPTGEAHYYLP
jgi:hypothetical protein